MKEQKSITSCNALTRVRKYFPNVKRVRDAKRTIVVRVKPIDATSGRKKDPGGCALARACIRERIADGAIIGVGNSWLIKGPIATRYKTSEAVSREIVSFDRHQDFAAGTDYKLSRVSPANRMNKRRPSGKGGRRKPALVIHRTANIRVLK